MKEPAEFPETPPPDCLKCGDQGFYDVQLPGEPEGHTRVRRCPCVRTKHYAARMEALDLENARFRGLTLSTYRPENEAQERALAACVAWAMAWPEVDRGILLQGPVGIGKTGLLWATAKAAGAEQCEVPHILRALDLAEAPVFRISGETDIETRNEIIERTRKRRLLVFDDLGTGKRSESADGAYFRLLDKRHLACLPTLVTTNYGEKEIQTQDGQTIESFQSRVRGRLFSRLQQSCDFYEIAGDDRRLKGTKP